MRLSSRVYPIIFFLFSVIYFPAPACAETFDDDFEYATAEERYNKTKETEILRMIRETTAILHRENMDILERIQKIEAELKSIEAKLDKSVNKNKNN